MKKIIFSTEITDEDLKCAEEWLQEQGYPSSEMAICEEAAEQKQNWQDDEISNLDMFLEGNILLIADLGLWNGRKSGYRIIDNNVGNILSSLSEGEIEYFADTQTKQVKAVQHHHDGTNYITFREIKPGVNIDNLTEKIYNGTYTQKDISRYTRSLYPHVAKVYGW